MRSMRKLATVSGETLEDTGSNRLQNTLNPGMAKKYITPVSEEIEGKFKKKPSPQFSRMESHIFVFCLNLLNFL